MYVVLFIYQADAERMFVAVVAGFDSVEVLVVAPTVEKDQTHRVNVVVGIECSMLLLRVTYIFNHSREILRFGFREKAKEAYASLAASNWRRS